MRTYIPRRSRSRASTAVMGSWQESTPRAAYAVSFAQKLRDRDEDVEMGVAVDEPGDEHPAVSAEPLGPRAGQGGEVGPDRRDVLPDDADVPPDDLAGVNVDDLAPGDQEVGRLLAERHPHETSPIAGPPHSPTAGAPLPLIPDHPAVPAGMIRRVQRRRAVQVRSNSA